MENGINVQLCYVWLGVRGLLELGPLKICGVSRLGASWNNMLVEIPNQDAQICIRSSYICRTLKMHIATLKSHRVITTLTSIKMYSSQQYGMCLNRLSLLLKECRFWRPLTSTQYSSSLIHRSYPPFPEILSASYCGLFHYHLCISRLRY